MFFFKFFSSKKVEIGYRNRTIKNINVVTTFYTNQLTRTDQPKKRRLHVATSYNLYDPFRSPDTYGCTMRGSSYSCTAPDRLSWTMTTKPRGGWRCGNKGGLHYDKSYIKELWYL